MKLHNITKEEDSNMAINGYSAFPMFHISSQIFLFIIGTGIQIKIISTCKKEKGATWKLQVISSTILMINFAFNISFDAIIHFIPSLASYTGPWFCYLASFINYYCFYSIVANSLIISIMKYIFIVHQITPSSDQGSSVKSTFFIIYLLHPLFLTLCNVMTSDWGSFSSLQKCFSPNPENSINLKNIPTNTDGEEKPFLCIYGFSNRKTSDLDIHLIVKQIICILRTIVNLAANTNILEIFFYYKIFKKMRW